MPLAEGVPPEDRLVREDRDSALARYLNLKLASLGAPVCAATADPEFLEIAGPLLRNFQQKDQLLTERLCPVDARIQAFLDGYLPGGKIRLPARTFVLDRPGMARMMSLPADRDEFISPLVSSYRAAQGVLHNPVKDRRTTEGVFHVADKGFPVPADKRAVPVEVFGRLLAAALEPPEELLTLPYTSTQPEPARLFVSLLLRPLVCPANGRDPEKSMEIRFFAPGSLVSNLDFVETIFGNTPRIVLASMIAFWCGTFVNSYVLAKMKVWTNGRWLWTRTIGSTLCGEAVDTLLFYGIAFYGLWSGDLLLKVMAAQYVLKTSWEIVMTPVTYRVVAFLKRVENEDYYDRDTDFTPFSLKT